MSGKKVQIAYYKGKNFGIEQYTIPLAPTIALNPKKTLPKIFTGGDYCAVLAVDHELGGQVKSSSSYTKIYRGNLLYLSNCNVQMIFMFPKDIKTFFPRDLWIKFTTSILSNEARVQKYKEIMAAYFRLRKAAEDRVNDQKIFFIDI